MGWAQPKMGWARLGLIFPQCQWMTWLEMGHAKNGLVQISKSSTQKVKISIFRPPIMTIIFTEQKTFDSCCLWCSLVLKKSKSLIASASDRFMSSPNVQHGASSFL